MASGQLPHPEPPQPQALCGAKHFNPFELSVFEIAGDHLGSIPQSQAASVNTEPIPYSGLPAKYASILCVHSAKNASLPISQLTSDNPAGIAYFLA